MDRYLYINQNSKFFQKENEESQTNEVNSDQAINNSNLEKKENKTYFDKILLCKLILHLFVLIEFNFLIYIWYPLQGSIYMQINTGRNDLYNYSDKNPYLLILNGLFCCYLYCSALQIKFGYSGYKKKSFLMKFENSVILKLFEWQRNIPVIYFSKNFIDHVFTNSSLDKMEYSKFNLINDSCFYSIIKKNKKRKIWAEILLKIFDWIMLIFIILLLIFLLLINSELSPWSQYVDINNAKIGFQLSFVESKIKSFQFRYERNISSFDLFTTDDIDSYAHISKYK